MIRRLALAFALSAAMTGLASAESRDIEALGLRSGIVMDAGTPSEPAPQEVVPETVSAAAPQEPAPETARVAESPAAQPVEAVPAQLARAAPAPGRAWCQGEVRIGGFCLVN